MSTVNYGGDELEIFASARRWKRYWAELVRPHVGTRVLEVGAGIGGNTALLNRGIAEWLCLEPDPALAQRIVERNRRGELGTRCAVMVGTLSDLPARRQFDTIIYIDVLEHIEDDLREVERVALHLQAGGCLVVLGPAHPRLFSPFDAAIGHYRRYTKATLTALTPPALELVSCRYLDSVGMAASAVNRYLLRKIAPTKSQVWFWDKAMVPLSRVSDRLLSYSFGKSIIAIWRRR